METTKISFRREELFWSPLKNDIMNMCIWVWVKCGRNVSTVFTDKIEKENIWSLVPFSIPRMENWKIKRHKCFYDKQLQTNFSLLTALMLPTEKRSYSTKGALLRNHRWWNALSMNKGFCLNRHKLTPYVYRTFHKWTKTVNGAISNVKGSFWT